MTAAKSTKKATKDPTMPVKTVSRENLPRRKNKAAEPHVRAVGVAVTVGVTVTWPRAVAVAWWEGVDLVTALLTNVLTYYQLASSFARRRAYQRTNTNVSA